MLLTLTKPYARVHSVIRVIGQCNMATKSHIKSLLHSYKNSITNFLIDINLITEPLIFKARYCIKVLLNSN